MAEYRQPKNTLKKQVSLMLPTEIYEGAKRDAKKYNRSMAYHIVETLRITFSEAIQEVQTEREQAAKINILEQFKVQAQSEGRNQNWLTLLESIFWKFAESKPAEDLGPDFLPDLFTFVTIMEESHKT
ncbi:hypothetical protein CMK19_17060 [Candidatus Poribacteria bacterium]|nr:hypothetical protein [Candidatus Poribacteria bacterium]